MRALLVLFMSCLTSTALAAPPAPAHSPAVTSGLPTSISAETKECLGCHKDDSPAQYQQWGQSKHYRANVGCYECHRAEKSDADALDHNGFTIAVLVTPKDCSRCHAREVAEFAGSRHSKAGQIIGSLDNTLAEVVEGNRGFKTPGFPGGNSAAAVNGCWQCHGSTVKVKDGKLDVASWPNSGVGRLNPDGSEGSCAACHMRHDFSAAQARHPNTCGKCHLGPDHPQKEIYEESKHGIAFAANVGKMNLDSPKWIVGEDYSAAPTCATCHMSATRKQGVTHDIGMRISWNNRPVLSVRPEVADAKMGLPGGKVGWEARRKAMKDVCTACHNEAWADSFYTQYDASVTLYNDKFGKPGLELYNAAKPLLGPGFSQMIDYVWYEIWHHEGRRARHGAAMMAPDYTHWHGTYEVARNFYGHYVPLLRELIEKFSGSADKGKADAAKALGVKLDAVLASPDHQWFLGKKADAAPAPAK